MADLTIPTVDARGHRCPTPSLRLRRALDAVDAGETVLLLADDPLARIDILHFASTNGHGVVDLNVEDGVIRALIRKGA